MIEIVRYGPNVRREIECPDCGSILKYGQEDIMTDIREVIAVSIDDAFVTRNVGEVPYIKCPACGGYIVVEMK